MRGFKLGGLIRAIGTIDHRKQRIATLGLTPAFTNSGQRQAHAIGGLMTGDADTAVGSEWLKKRLLPRVSRRALIQCGDNSGRVRVTECRGQLSCLTRRPPAIASLLPRRSRPPRLSQQPQLLL